MACGQLAFVYIYDLKNDGDYGKTGKGKNHRN